VKGFVHAYLEKNAERFSLRETKKEYAAVKRIKDAGSAEIREALNELARIEDNEILVTDTAKPSEPLPDSLRTEGSLT